ncbi:SRPBCC family protein [Klugiella xanthotipulae]|uniref:Uncharacterized protein YndB with AHSA1/START domain n=1 Tax=Klugiella xanthotipulae TaxID=244735 RepID=A0A543I751_9MICO|nr:SRPBCC domain-containing protein [Klugiella xanthotipulae]TQM66369.1 uncharacterized protein YndB with AHSA1/START domain [Klugiella xanthotipulae]
MSGITQDLVIFRHFAAPPRQVYHAFIDPDTIAEWFGPDGWHVPRDTIAVDARAGGYQRLVMVSDDNPELTAVVDTTFSEVIENLLLVAHQDVPDMDGDGTITRLTTSLTFTEEGSGTQLELVQGPFSAEVAAGPRSGWEESFATLDRVLQKREK